MMAGGAALPSRGFAGTRRHLRVITWGGSTTLGLGFCVNPAAIEHDFRGVWKWFSCYSGIKTSLSNMKIAAFEHGLCSFRA